ncbi:secreted RxLR effector protein 161-like [Cicer arietinum]|uniref:secreted RxLR effector protein 161-like n=1 Tax=Cicer arietinum TaxID=3827 RepID=UPI003CC50E82
MANCNPATIPMEINAKLEIEIEEEPTDLTLFKQVGSIRYLCNTRSDICDSLGVVSRFMERPKHSHWLAVKRIMRYIQGTIGHGIMFATNLKHENEDLVGYSYSDWCGDKNDIKRTSGYVFKFMKSPIAWSSKKQPVIALSSCKAEYIDVSYEACQALWLESLTTELKMEICRPIPLLIDNISTINLAKNHVSHERSKYIETKFHFLRDQVERSKLKLIYCQTEVQLTDIMTKALRTSIFEFVRRLLSVKSLRNLD